jgi:arylsulfatase A-like enzyme
VKQIFLSVLMLVAWASAERAGAAPDASRPNFLIILSDDQGYDDLSCHGNTIAETPRLDRLAGQAMQFTQFYVEPACAPTRASLLTGRSFIRTGVWSVHFGGDYVGLDETNFAQVLGKAGYATAQFGKWHSGKIPGYLPEDRGFQTVQIADLYIHKDNAFRIGDAPAILYDVWPYREQKQPGYTTDRLADAAIDYLRKNKDKPFCLYLPEIAVHSPWEAPKELIQKYQKKGISARFAALYGLTEQMDTSIGRVLDELDTLKLSDNTVVLFFSDNGAVHKTIGTHAGSLSDAEIKLRNVSNLRGIKGTIFEGGTRSPLMVRWPGKITPGKTSSIAHVYDLLPTLVDLAGAAMPANAKPLDGKSLKPLLTGQIAQMPARTIFGSELGIPSPTRPPKPPIRKNLDLHADRSDVNYETARIYAREQRFKLIKRGKNLDLFDMSVDPSETTDVKAKFPEDAARLEASLKAWFTGVLHEEAPFNSPLHLIGRPDSPGAVLHFNGAYRLTGDFAGNGEWAHSLSASQSGSSATFAVRVITPGKYRVVLEATVAGMGNRCTVTCGNATMAAALNKGDLHELGTIDVADDAKTLIFTLEKDEGAPAVKDFWNIVLLDPKSGEKIEGAGGRRHSNE